MFLLFSAFCLFGMVTYALDGHNIIKEAVLIRYRRFREVNKLVQTRYKTIGMILWVSISMIAKMYWINFLQWANNTIEHIDSKTILISYVINGKLYKMVVRPRKGPNSVLLVTDERSNDLSDQIIPFLGPYGDWHGKEFSPAFWDKKSLTFELADGTQKTFNVNDIIKLNN